MLKGSVQQEGAGAQLNKEHPAIALLSPTHVPAQTLSLVDAPLCIVIQHTDAIPFTVQDAFLKSEAKNLLSPDVDFSLHVGTKTPWSSCSRRC